MKDLTAGMTEAERTETDAQQGDEDVMQDSAAKRAEDSSDDGRQGGRNIRASGR